jgi:hypothetical protein
VHGRPASNSPDGKIRESASMTISDEGVHHQTNAPRAECIRCRTVYPRHLVEHVFRAHRAGQYASCPDYRKRVCRACEQTVRDQRKQRNRWAVKARDVIRRHATRFGIDRDELVTVFGWDPQRLAHDAEHQYTSTPTGVATATNRTQAWDTAFLTSRSTFKTALDLPTTARTPSGVARPATVEKVS